MKSAAAPGHDLPWDVSWLIYALFVSVQQPMSTEKML